jgi:hypothetical protein
METELRIMSELVTRVSFLAPAAEIALTGQDSCHGTGFPQRLGGEEIPPGACIFASAETLDATAGNKPSRKALPSGGTGFWGKNMLSATTAAQLWCGSPSKERGRILPGGRRRACEESPRPLKIDPSSSVEHLT